MSTPFLGEIRIMSFNFPPKGWTQCNGQFLPINQNQALFSLLGTTYGGNGQTTFALPDLRGRIPIHIGNGHVWGEAGGQEFHTVTQSELPQHTHTLQANSAVGDTNDPANNFFAKAHIYRSASELAALSPQTVSNIGGSQPHENRQPFSVLNFCIALTGIFPSGN